VQEVALLVAESYPSSAAIAAAYLHDHEDYGRDWNYGRLEREFGNQVAMPAGTRTPQLFKSDISIA